MSKFIKPLIILVISCIGILAVSYLIKTKAPGKFQNNQNQKDQAQLANPASKYCLENQGSLKKRMSNDGGEYSVCFFKDGSECEEWAFFRKECNKSQKRSGANVGITQEFAQIRDAVMKSEKISDENYSITVSSFTNDFAKGSIKPKTEGIGGAYFFAAKDKGVWTVLQAGNGALMCDSFAKYPEFPKDWVAECIDSTGKLIKR